MPKLDTVSIFGIATSNSAYNFWLNIATNADKMHKTSSILYELQEMIWDKGIDCTKESFLKNYDWKDSYLSEEITPEEVFEYIDFDRGYIDDEVTIMQYWKDYDGYLPGIWEFNDENPKEATIVIELSVGGPNAHLLITYNTDEISPYPNVHNGLEKIEFQYHWWSPVYTLDFTTLPEEHTSEERLMYEAAQECIEQIHETMYDNLRL